MKVNRSWFYLSLIVLAAAFAGYMVSLQLDHGGPTLASGTTLPAPRPLTAFTLTDHHGANFGNVELSGRPSLVFFGFTHCPDVCPTTLALMAQLQRDPALEPLRMLFITVDPQRDDQLALQRYVAAFGEGLTGLRGEDAALEPLLQNLGAARRVAPRAGADYAVDHSATLFYINAKGALSAVFSPPFDYANLRSDLAALVASSY
ncbi:MAG: SCO family protein [Steroidobacteraceae bacterium]